MVFISIFFLDCNFAFRVILFIFCIAQSAGFLFNSNQKEIKNARPINTNELCEFFISLLLLS